MTPATTIDVAPATMLDPASRRLMWGVSGLYFALYLHFGFFSFIPLWMKATGASPQEVGLLMAIPLVLRLLTVAPVSAWAGRHGRVRDAFLVSVLVSAAVICLLIGRPDHARRVAVVILFSLAWDQLPVLSDAYATMAVRARGLDFGRMRVWGSLAVVGSTASAGWVFDAVGIGALPWIVALLLLLPAAAAPLLPSDRDMATSEPGVAGKWRDVMADRPLMRALVATSLIMGSHGVLTSFGAIQWSAQGISTGTIGLLQALAVSAEIVAFWFGARALGQRDPRLLIGIAAGAAVVRWLIMATEPGVPLLIAAQLLHSITSTGAILGSMLIIAQRVPLRTNAAAQGLYAVMLGVALAVTMAGSGLLWSYGVAWAYAAMAALALVAMTVAWPFGAQRSNLQGQGSLT